MNKKLSIIALVLVFIYWLIAIIYPENEVNLIISSILFAPALAWVFLSRTKKTNED